MNGRARRIDQSFYVESKRGRDGGRSNAWRHGR